MHVLPGVNTVASFALVISALVIQFTSGINYILVPLKLLAQDCSTSLIGVAMAFEILATLFLFKKLDAVVRYFGVIKVVVYASVIRAVVVLLYSQLNHFALWLLSIFVYGLVSSLLLVVVQTWLNTSTHGKTKGIFIGLYSSALSCGIALSPVAFYFFKDHAWASGYPFWVGAIGALVPMLVLAPFLKIRPKLENAEAVRVKYVLKNAKKIMLSALVGGVCFYGLPSFLTIYGIKNDLPSEQASFLMTTFMLGSVTLGMLGSSLSGFLNRQRLILFCMAISAICAVFLSLVVYTSYAAALVLLFVWGGSMGSIYAIGLAIIGDAFRPNDQVGANMSYVLMDSCGGLLGLCIIGVAMDMFNAEGLSYTIAISCTAYLLYVLMSLDFKTVNLIKPNLICGKILRKF